MDGGLLHNQLIVIAGHNYVLVNPQELNPYFGRQFMQSIISQSRDLTLVDLLVHNYVQL